MIRNILLTLGLTASLAAGGARAAEHYVIDTKGMHAFVTFRISHLGFSFIEGRFNRFRGEFDFDEANPANNRVEVEIDIASIDTNNPERDKHLRSEDFFDVKAHPKATFVSTGWEDLGDGRAKLKGRFSLRGVAQEITLDVTPVGAGDDPWGSYRRGFVATTTLRLSDYGMEKAGMLGPTAENVQILLSLEGIRK